MNKKIFMIEESLYEFAKRGRPKKKGRKAGPHIKGIESTDVWDDTEDEDFEEIEDVDAADMEDVEEIEVEEELFDDKLLRALNNELKSPEFNRRIVKFRLKGDLGKILWGVPLAKVGKSTFIFKLKDGSIKKIALKNMVLEQEKLNYNRAKTINEEIEWPEEMEREWTPERGDPDQDDDDEPYPGGLTQDDYEDDDYSFEESIWKKEQKKEEMTNWFTNNIIDQNFFNMLHITKTPKVNVLMDENQFLFNLGSYINQNKDFSKWYDSFDNNEKNEINEIIIDKIAKKFNLEW